MFSRGKRIWHDFTDSGYADGRPSRGMKPWPQRCSSVGLGGAKKKQTVAWMCFWGIATGLSEENVPPDSIFGSRKKRIEALLMVSLIYFSLGSWFELIPNCQEPGKVSGVGVSAALSPRNKAGAEQVSSPDQSLEFVKKVISNSTSFKFWIY